MENALHVLLSGITLGAIYSLLGVAFVVIMKTTEIVHFALGEYLMAAVVVALVLMDKLTFSLPAAVLAALAFAALLGVTTDYFVARPLRESSVVNAAFAMVAISILIENLVLILWRGDTVAFPSFLPQTPLNVLGVSVVPQNLFAIGVVCLCMVVLQFFFVRTKIGMAMRAVMEDRETASLMGVRVEKIVTLCFLLSGILSAIAGVIVAPIINVTYDMGIILIKVFVAVVIGGLYSIPGAVAGGLLLGVMENFTSSYVSSTYRDVIVYSLLILGLIFKPTGLFIWRRGT